MKHDFQFYTNSDAYNNELRIRAKNYLCPKILFSISWHDRDPALRQRQLNDALYYLNSQNCDDVLAYLHDGVSKGYIKLKPQGRDFMLELTTAVQYGNIHGLEICKGLLCNQQNPCASIPSIPPLPKALKKTRNATCDEDYGCDPAYYGANLPPSEAVTGTEHSDEWQPDVPAEGVDLLKVTRQVVGRG